MAFVRGPTTMFAALLAATSVQAGGDPEQGRSKSVQCVSCHGAKGETTNPTFPDLAGQNASYLAIQLQHFKSGKRYHPLMSPIAEALSEDDIADLSAYFSRLGDEQEE